MSRKAPVVFFLAVVAAAGVAPARAEEMSEVERMSFCGRVRDFAVQAFFDREKGRPMRVFPEDGGAGPRITNHIVRRIYEEPQISSPKKVDAYSRATCNEMLLAERRPAE